ncbi:hypothetical protein GCM10017788_69530 [Amycolatopsis acidiphila]|nr:hypothetical protein GCM10017788_69530 [Amycolatopsis acidiphila]
MTYQVFPLIAPDVMSSSRFPAGNPRSDVRPRRSSVTTRPPSVSPYARSRDRRYPSAFSRYGIWPSVVVASAGYSVRDTVDSRPVSRTRIATQLALAATARGTPAVSAIRAATASTPNQRISSAVRSPG